NRLPAIAFRWSISAVFTLWLFAPNAQAQSAATAINGNKKACDFVTKSDAESILGQPVEMGVNNAFECSFIETGRANKVQFKQVSLNVRFEASPDDYAVARKNISDHQGATEVVKEVPNFSDAAIWRWIPPAWGEL